MKKQFTRNLIWILTTVFVFGLRGQIDPTLATQLQQILDGQVAAGKKGVSACVILSNGDVWKGVSGVGQNSVISDTTVFHGASITKTNMATLILLLAESNLLHLDSVWTKYLSLNAAFNSSITIRQLLNHTSGIKDYLETPASGTLITSDFSHAFTPYEILENIVDDTPLAVPGASFSYATSNYALLALIAQTVTGNPVQQELRNRIWDPLGMTHTYFGGFETYTEPKAGVWWDFGSGVQDYSSQPVTAMLTYGYGGANIVTTPADLAIFARALCTGTLLSPTSLNQMKTFVPGSYSFWNGYGLGAHRFPGINNTLGHDGFYTNLSDMFHSYDYGFTLVSMTNTFGSPYSVFNPLYNALKSYITDVKQNLGLVTAQIFPNPSKEYFWVRLNRKYESVGLTITDVAGKVVYKILIRSTEQLQVDTKILTKGAYLVKIETADFTETKKLIIGE